MSLSLAEVLQVATEHHLAITIRGDGSIVGPDTAKLRALLLSKWGTPLKVHGLRGNGLK